MRLLFAAFMAGFISIVGFFTVKFWGLSQRYTAYDHPLYNLKDQTYPIIFKKIEPKNLETLMIQSKDPLYIDVANTRDQKVVITSFGEFNKIEIRNKLYDQFKDQFQLLTDFKEQLQNRILIFNVTESAIGGHLIFVDTLKQLGLDQSSSVIIMSPYDLVTRAVKEQLPTFLYGTSKPEILRIKSMESLYLIEAASFQADLVIYPLQFYKQTFFTENLMTELIRRHKKIIIGPISKEQYQQNLKTINDLKPMGVVVSE